jgi:hypothetical protein
MERRPTGSCERIETDPASHLTFADGQVLRGLDE